MKIANDAEACRLNQLIARIWPYTSKCPANPAGSLDDAFYLLEIHLGELGGCFSTADKGWLCYFTPESEVQDDNPCFAICKSFIRLWE